MIAGNNSNRVPQPNGAIAWICLATGYDNTNSQAAPIPQNCNVRPYTPMRCAHTALCLYEGYDQQPER